MRKVLFSAALIAAIMPLAVLGITQSANGASEFKFGLHQFKPSGTVSVDPAEATSVAKLPASVRGALAIPPTSATGVSGCPDTSATNVRANTDCTNQPAPGFFGRSISQNETAVAVNPRNPNNVLISQNDYRRGDGNCGVDWSLDGGQHWGSQTAPQGFARPVLNNGGLRHYWTSGGDTSVAFDTSGEAYLMCQLFDRGFPTDEAGPPVSFGASAFAIFRSADGGASWSFPGDYVITDPGPQDPNSDIILLDKQYMTIDTTPGSPYKNRIYVSWTPFRTDNSNPIALAYSDDHGVTWHQSGDISGSSQQLCPIGFSPAPPGTCDNDQFSVPFTAPNGDLFVTFINGNNCNGFTCGGGNHGDNHLQILLVKSTDGGKTFTGPVKVSDYYDLPDCLTYTGYNAFRSCVPTQPLSATSIFRAANYPSGVAQTNQTIVVDFGSYINRHSSPSLGNCRPTGNSKVTGLPRYNGVGVPGGCNNDIVRSVSTDGGLTFTGTNTPVENLGTLGDSMDDQWWQWTAKSPSGAAVASFFDRSYGDDEQTGYNDVSLFASAKVTRVTDVSNPPSNEFPAANGYSTFMGDYTGLAVGADGVAHPAWPDTRNPFFTFDLSGDARVLTAAGYGADTYTRSIQL